MSEYRLGELAALTGISVRNIRAYRERGLLDVPRRVGRSAFYDDRHLAQLRAVTELLRRGFTSAHIAEFLDGTRQGRDLAGILGLEQVALVSPRRPGTAAVGVDPNSDEARRLVRSGLAEVVDGEVTLVDSTIAEIVGRVTEPLAYVQTILRVADGVAGLLDELAIAVVGVLEESLFGGLDRDEAALPDDAAELRRTVADYRVLGRRVVAERFESALQRHLVDGAPDDDGDPDADELGARLQRNDR